MRYIKPRQLFDTETQTKTPERIKYDELMAFARDVLAKDYPVLNKTEIILKDTKRGYAFAQEEFTPRRIYLPRYYLWDYSLLTSKLILVHETCHQILGIPKDRKEIHGKEFQELETNLMQKYFNLRPIYSLKDDYGTLGYAVEYQDVTTGKIFHKWQGVWKNG